jgi:amidase
MKEHTIPELQQQMQAGTLAAEALAEAYLARIQEIDTRDGSPGSPPGLNAVIEVNPDAPRIARELDAERAERGPRGPLHGIPVIVKDNIDTADRMQTTAGSLALSGSIAAQDATLVAWLRRAGAVLLGKANLSEWANFRSTHSTSGWSSRGGQTRNPYALDRNPCGSSSGSAVAVAANLCAAAVGTETDGSIICPSHTNGIVGLKPTLGLVSRAGIVPIAHSQDTAGPMGRTVADVAALLGAMVGTGAGAVDPRDPATADSEGRTRCDYTQFLDPDGLRQARIGVARGAFGFDARVDDIIEGCIRELARLGATIIDPAEIETAGQLAETEFEVLLYEFKADLNAYLGALGPDAPVHSLDEVIAFNEAHREEVMPYFGQERMLAAQGKGPLTEPDYLEALAANHRLARDEGIDATLRKHELDAIVAPSGAPACLIDWVRGDQRSSGSSSPAAVAGYPNLTVPAGYVFGLPVGISFIAGAFQEPTLLRLGYAFEQATRVRRTPRFLPTVAFAL